MMNRYSCPHNQNNHNHKLIKSRSRFYNVMYNYTNRVKWANYTVSQKRDPDIINCNFGKD